MNIEQAAKVAKRFLEDETTEPKYYGKSADGVRAPKVSLQHVATTADGIDVLFMVDEEGTENDPEVKKLAGGAMKALEKAHPGVFKYKVTHKVWGP